MMEKTISEYIFERLRDFGAIKWHKNKNHSFYIKFKDVRLGSIRISNHQGREQYRYTYEIFKSERDVERKMEDVIASIISKSKEIYNFNPEKYIVFDKENRCYIEVENFQQYKDHIHGK